MLARRDELGNRAAFCAGCGWGRRFLGGVPDDLPASCPDCGQPVIAACPACDEGITSLMQITCSSCGEALREAEFFGRPIRRKPERHAAPAEAPQCAGEAAAAFASE
jgi:predicted amidophosphoribosyltransferase